MASNSVDVAIVPTEPTQNATKSESASVESIKSYDFNDSDMEFTEVTRVSVQTQENTDSAFRRRCWRTLRNVGPGSKVHSCRDLYPGQH